MPSTRPQAAEDRRRSPSARAATARRLVRAAGDRRRSLSARADRASRRRAPTSQAAGDRRRSLSAPEDRRWRLPSFASRAVADRRRSLSARADRGCCPALAPANRRCRPSARANRRAHRARAQEPRPQLDAAREPAATCAAWARADRHRRRRDAAAVPSAGVFGFGAAGLLGLSASADRRAGCVWVSADRRARSCASASASPRSCPSLRNRQIGAVVEVERSVRLALRRGQIGDVEPRFGRGLAGFESGQRPGSLGHRQIGERPGLGALLLRRDGAESISDTAGIGGLAAGSEAGCVPCSSRRSRISRRQARHRRRCG